MLFVKVNESSTTVGSPGEALSKRCVLLLKTALKPGFWQGKLCMMYIALNNNDFWQFHRLGHRHVRQTEESSSVESNINDNVAFVGPPE